MGRKLDALLGRTFKPSKFKTFVNLAISRLAVLKNQRQVRYSHARSDVAQLLEIGQQERALLRVEHVIKEQNMFDAFIMMEGYCNILIERVALIENQKDCPDELKEAISGLIFAASRCGEFPELLHIRDIFTSRFGKEFTASAVELRNHCGVNPRMIQKMSTRQPSLESRLKVAKEIASEKGITLKLEESSSGVTEEDLNNSKKTQKQAKPNRSDAGGKTENSVSDRMEDGVHNTSEIDPDDDQTSGSMKARKKYADVASAAQAAFESAAHAALAARAAVELSRSESHDKGSDDESSPGTRGRNRSNENRDDGFLKHRAGFGIAKTEVVGTGGMDFEKIHPIQQSSSDSEDEELPVKGLHIPPEEFKCKPKAKLERSASATSLDSTGVTFDEINMLNEAGRTKPLEKAIHFDESEEETENDWAKIPFKANEFHLDEESILLEEVNKSPRTSDRLPKSGRAGYGLEKNYADSDENEGIKLHYPNRKQNLISSQADSVHMQHEVFGKMRTGLGNDGTPVAYSAEKHVKKSEIKNKPVSVRTRRGFK